MCAQRSWGVITLRDRLLLLHILMFSQSNNSDRRPSPYLYQHRKEPIVELRVLVLGDDGFRFMLLRSFAISARSQAVQYRLKCLSPGG